MSQEPKKVSRRQAIKLLTATAGAATMASVPNKWVKPILKAGVLPAHAQTSTPVPPATSTSTPTNTPTSTATNTPTATPTNTPTATATNTPTATATIGPTSMTCTGEIDDLGFTDIYFSNVSATLNLAVSGVSVSLQITVTDDFGNTIGGPTDYGPVLTDASGIAAFSNVDISHSPVDGGDITATLDFTADGITPCQVILIIEGEIPQQNFLLT